jgi:hypothetical protein
LTEWHEVRSLVVALATGRPVRGVCANWTSRRWEFAISEGLGPWLYKVLNERDELEISAEVKDLLRRHYRWSAVVSLNQEVALGKIARAFHDRGIPVILLKGCYLGRFVYKDQAIRPMVDVDVFVAEERFEQACRQLEDLGYKTGFGTNPFEEKLLRSPKVYVLSGEVSQFVDVHRAIRAMDYYDIPSETVWAEAVEYDFLGSPVRYLTPELNFIHLALHNLNHGGMLRDWLDLLLLRQVTNLDCEKLVGLARAVGAMRPLFWAVQELERNWKAPLPPSVAEAFRSHVPHWWEDLLIRNKYCYFWRLGARLALMKGWRNRLRYLAGKVAHPDSEARTEFFSGAANMIRSKVSLIRHLGARRS